MPRVAIVSVAQTPFRERREETVRELIYRVSREALGAVGLSHQEVDTVITASSDYWQGMGCSNVFYYEGAASYLKDSPKVEGDGTLALIYACLRLLSGHHKTALVASVAKGSEVASIPTLTALSSDPFFQRPVGLEEVSAAGLQARLYLQATGAPAEALDRAARRDLFHALFNPLAHRKGDYTPEQVGASEPAALPLRRLHCAPLSDGACALLLATEERAKDLTPEPVWVLGFGWAADTYALGERDLLSAGALTVAARQAYRMAGITDPRREISLLELSAPYVHQEFLWLEGLGFTPPGEGWRLAVDEATSLDGPLPVNPSGGLLGANPPFTRGLVRVAEACLHLWGRAGVRQVKNPRTALAHGVYGLAGQCHGVVLLGRE